MTIQQAIQNASPESIISAAIKLKQTYFPSERWLFRNRYAKDTINKIEKEGNNAPHRPAQMAQYVAASVVIHCSDGWNFFSNAVDSLLNGDISNTVFMAYYAQIRAMMSFFASEGIGIFNRRHFWFDQTGNCYSFKCNTHTAIRSLTQEWADSPSRKGRLLQLLHVDNRSFGEWISGANVRLGTPLLEEFERDWFKTWSIDLNILGEDHNIRNETSYRPQRVFPYSANHDFENDLKTCLEIWKVSEPFGLNHFAQLDRHLLRATFKTVYRNRTTHRPYGRGYEGFVRDSMINIGISPNGDLYDFLTNRSFPNNLRLLTEASRKGMGVSDGIHAIPILSRAFLLLRLASAAVDEFLGTCSITADDISFWWTRMGEEMGIWPPGNPPTQTTDLWVDVDEAIQVIEEWVNRYPGGIQLLETREHYPSELWRVRQFNRLGLWAMGL